MKARIGPIVELNWLFSFMNCLFDFGISLTQQLTIWADVSLHRLLQKSSMARLLVNDALGANGLLDLVHSDGVCSISVSCHLKWSVQVHVNAEGSVRKCSKVYLKILQTTIWPNFNLDHRGTLKIWWQRKNWGGEIRRF